MSISTQTATQTAVMNPPPDASVVRRAQKGDASAFAALFEAHRPKIYAICLRMTNNIAEAEDLTQDAFIHVFRKLSTFRGDSAFSTWLYRIAVNTVLMHFRKRSNSQVSLDQPNTQDSNLPKHEYGRVDEQLAGCVDRLALARAINELPSGYRMIFLLHEVRGFEHKEIARLLHCSVGNSKSQLHKAKLRMRKLLAPARFARHRSAAAALVAGRTVAPGMVSIDSNKNHRLRKARPAGRFVEFGQLEKHAPSGRSERHSLSSEKVGLSLGLLHELDQVAGRAA